MPGTDETQKISSKKRWNDDMDSDDMFSEEDNAAKEDSKHNLEIFGTGKLWKINNEFSKEHLHMSQHSQEQTPERPFVPKTPLSLIPLITQGNESWTSDLETPKINAQHLTPNPFEKFPENIKDMNRTPNIQLPHDEVLPHSPVIANKKRSLPKRQIFQPLMLVESNFDAPINQHSTTLKEEVKDEAATETNVIDDLPDTIPISEEENELMEVEKHENLTTWEKEAGTEMKANTSTQYFFENASFSAIDKMYFDKLENTKEAGKVENEETRENDVLEQLQKVKQNLNHLYFPDDMEYAQVPEKYFFKEIIQLEVAEKNCVLRRKSSLEPLPLGLMTATELIKFQNEPVGQPSEKVVKCSDVKSKDLVINPKTSTSKNVEEFELSKTKANSHGNNSSINSQYFADLVQDVAEDLILADTMIEENEQNVKERKEVDKTEENQGQCTGSSMEHGSNIAVRNDAILGFKKPVLDKDFQFPTERSAGKSIGFPGFATASGKDIKITEDAILRGKKIFSNEDLDISLEKFEEQEKASSIDKTSFPNLGDAKCPSGKFTCPGPETNILEAQQMYNIDKKNSCVPYRKMLPGLKLPITSQQKGKRKLAAETRVRSFGEFGMMEKDTESQETNIKKRKSDILPIGRFVPEEASKKCNDFDSSYVWPPINFDLDKIFEKKSLPEIEGNGRNDQMEDFRGFDEKEMKESLQAEHNYASAMKLSEINAAVPKPPKMAVYGSLDFSFDVPESKESKIEVNDGNGKSAFEGFKTAHGKSINVPATALAKGAEILSEQNLQVFDAKLKAKFNDSSKKNISNDFSSIPGFTTAAGSELKVSEETLKKGTAIFSKELDLKLPEMCDEIEDEICGKMFPKKRKLGDSGRNEALELRNSTSLTRKLLPGLKLPITPKQGTERKCTTETRAKSLGEFGTNTPGFSTAAGGQLKVSAEMLKKAAAIFSRELDEDMTLKSMDIGDDELCSEMMLGKPKLGDSGRNVGSKLKIPQMGNDLFFKNPLGEGIPEEETPPDENLQKTLLESASTSPIVRQRPPSKDYMRKLFKRKNSRPMQEEKCDFGAEEKEPRVGFEVSENSGEDSFTAVLEQDKLIREKKLKRPKPVLGTLLKYRNEHKNRRVTWKQITGDSNPIPRDVSEFPAHRISPKVLDVTASNAASYVFEKSEIIDEAVAGKAVIAVKMRDTRLILDQNGNAGVSEFTRAFLASLGVDPSLVPLGWVENHYRWIVWKLASLDRMKFGTAFMPRALTVTRVMEELKYRYDREIDRSERSVLRKILEKDAVSSQRMVLCVTSVKQDLRSDESEQNKSLQLRMPSGHSLEVTDGWYSIPLFCDFSMLNHVACGKVKEGTKIVTCGAELLNCEQGCHPLEKQSNVSLKIHTNSTRRARWDTRLGLQGNSEPISVKLRDVDPHGGTIGKISVVIARIFPVLYREKTADGRSIFRNARCEEKAAAAFEQEFQEKAEALYARTEKSLGGGKCTDLSDCDIFSEDVTESQARKIMAQRQEEKERFEQTLQLQLKANMPPRRQVTTVLKVRIADENITALVTIWSEAEDFESLFKEGSCVDIYNTTASGKKCGELQLTCSRSTCFKPAPSRKIPYAGRIYSSIKDASQLGFSPSYSEFDTVGIVCSIIVEPNRMNNCHVLTIAHPNNDSSSSYLSIYFSQDVSTYGYGNMLAVGSIVACSNVELRRVDAQSVPTGYYSERTNFSCNPRQAHFREPFDNLKKLVRNPVVYAKKCAEEIGTRFEKKPNPASFNSPNSSMIQSPAGTRSVSVQKKLEKLSWYGKAPGLSPVMNISSNRTRSDFKPLCLSTSRLLENTKNVVKRTD